MFHLLQINHLTLAIFEAIFFLDITLILPILQFKKSTNIY